MTNALVFIVSTLVDLYIITFLLRIVLQWRRADFRNPLVQFILSVTNPLVLPLRRYIPPVYGLDTASLLVAFIIKIAELLLLLTLLCAVSPDALQLLTLAALGIVRTFLSLYFFMILIWVILSWVSPGNYNPAAALISQLIEPVLAPFRKFIPVIGGFDISPIFAIIGIQALMMLIPGTRVVAALSCSGDTANVPIIMVTSRSGEKHRARAIELGVNDYLGKPYQEQEMLEAVRSLLGDKAPASSKPGISTVA